MRVLPHFRRGTPLKAHTVSSPLRPRWLLALICLQGGCLGGDAWGEAYLVRPDGSGDYPTISAAVAAAQNGDEVVLGDGIFLGAANRNVVMFEKTLTIRSESGDPSRCIIDCEQIVRGGVDPNHAFEFIHTLDTEPVLEGITITRGWATLGGAVAFWYSSPRVRNCVFVDNTRPRRVGR